MSKRLLAVSALLLGLSVVLGIMTGGKTRALKASLEKTEAARMDAERLHAKREKEMKAREAAVASAKAKLSEDEKKVASAEEDLVKSQSEKEELLTKLKANDAEIADLKMRLAGGSPSASPGENAPPNAANLQTELEETKKQLDSAEKEKALLADKIRAAQERSDQLETEKRQRASTRANPNLRGTILAVNQAYNFVVLNLGARQGVEANAEMLVLRGGTLIGKIRVSSVEPATSIGDIIGSSLARGVQVQPGDMVVYAVQILRHFVRITACALLAAGGLLFASCASKQPAPLVSDPSVAGHESSLPWNEKQKWEDQGQFGGGITDQRR